MYYVNKLIKSVLLQPMLTDDNSIEIVVLIRFMHTKRSLGTLFPLTGFRFRSFNGHGLYNSSRQKRYK